MVRTSSLAALCAAGILAPALAAHASWSDPQAGTIEVAIDRMVVNEALPLHLLAGLGQAHVGRPLQAIKVEVNPLGAPGEVQLVVDGQLVDSVPTQGLHAVYLVPDPADAVFGTQVQTVLVRTVGAVVIDDIELTLGQPAGAPPPPPLTACVALEQTLDADIGFARLDVGALFDLAAHAGCRIESITIVASSATGNGRAMARVGGFQNSDWEQIAPFPAQYTFTFWSDPVIGAGLPEIALSFLGLFSVHSVRLDLTDA